MSRMLHATTPFPNHLLDEAMPFLKDTEWRILCVIVRQTLGWQSKDGKQRKTSDWMTQAQLVKKTGRDRAALSRAVDVLVQRQLIEVRNEKGNLLLSPQERRQCQSRLFYGLCAKSEYQAPGSNSLLKRKATKSEYHRAPKANTTKEIVTKEIVTKGIYQHYLERLTAEVFYDTQATVEHTLIQKQRVEPEYSLAAQRFIALFKQEYKQNKEQDAALLLSPRDAQRLEKLLVSHPGLDWMLVLRVFFGSQAGYVTRHNHSLPAFLDSCNIFLVRYKGTR